MHKLTKQILTGVIALGLLAPVATSSISNSPAVTVNARSRALSYYWAKRDVRKTYNGKDSLHDYFNLHNNDRHGDRTYLKASFGGNAEIYFTVIHYGRYAHIHVTIKASSGEADNPWYGNVSRRYYRTYGIRRNMTVRAY
ncbi:hypothetical protein [Acetilactobacillus jinshanensis]|uniref:Uncharacterized protein n=1 Tax=Acetilactobacillus jinshanensis TaxID=1720083 RepID=A0A4P6ZKH7_9LACO|nr:hypothetical protein [Acetilactobacillus jinshanensis]QBP18184.1 hypothetical protein ELX58_03315 [Acetilactobacillus jinshanensis]URL61051.1 hypothetical protein HGK75_03375 [uncultured bacterium]